MKPLRASRPGIAPPENWPSERRQRTRQKVYAPAYASFEGAHALDLHEVVDLHEEGFSAQAPPTLELDQHFQLQLVLSESKSSIPVSGRVVWSANGRVGIRLDTLNDESLKQLQEWLFLNAMTASVEDAPPTDAPPDPPRVLEDQSILLGALDAVRKEVHGPGLDFSSALNLLAERAAGFTNATGCAIALAEGRSLVCRARFGSDAPAIGDSFETGSGFSGEAVRTRSVLRCDDTENDSRVDQPISRALGIRSILAVPVLSGANTIGLLEVFSRSPRAFQAREQEVLVRMAGFAQPLIQRQRSSSTSSAQGTAPAGADAALFADFARGTVFQRSHFILLTIAAALIALVLGYLLAPWVERKFSRPANPLSLDPSALGSAPRLSGVSTTESSQSAPAGTAGTLDQLRQSAEQGDPAAQFALGTHYAIGSGVTRDSVLAARWFDKAAEQGHVIAQDTMGAYCWAGRGVPKDLHKAYFWSLLAQAANNETSKHRVVALNSLLTGPEIEAARRDAENWVRTHPQFSKSVTSHR